jgi:polyisoprenoid-binding protein YceI
LWPLGNSLHFPRPPHVNRGRTWSPGSSGRFFPVNLEDSMMRPLSALVLAILLGASAVAADAKYALTGENTKITFVGTKPGGKHDGGFKKVTGNATLTDGKIDTLKIEVDIDTDSLYSDNAKLTTHLKHPDFFGVKDNPKATFKTTKVEKTDKGYTITGDLTLIGTTKAVSFPATVAENGGTLTLSADFTIDRTDWGMNYGKGKVDDKVTLKVAFTAKK